MRDISKNYIDGAWVDPSTDDAQDIVHPATGAVSGRLALKHGGGTWISRYLRHGELTQAIHKPAFRNAQLC